MAERILLVDDDPIVLKAGGHQLRSRFETETAPGPKEGLAAVDNRGPYAVVISDMRMPEMDGIRFLAEVRRRTPDTVRMMLTGHADLETAIEAVNRGSIFRFLTKPCPPETFVAAAKAGVRQYRLIRSERDLLSQTLCGSVKLLTDVLSLVNPTAFGRADRIKRFVRPLCKELGVEPSWQVEVGAMLSQVGCVALPEDTLGRACRGEPLGPEELRLFQRHPLVARDLIANIPRLEGVAKIVAYQEKHFDGSGLPDDGTQGKAIPLGARILKAALDFDTITSGGCDSETAMAEIAGREGWYDPNVVRALRRVLQVQINEAIRLVGVRQLPDNAVLAEDVTTEDGVLLIPKGYEVTPSMRVRLLHRVETLGIREPIKVLVPIDVEEARQMARAESTQP